MRYDWLRASGKWQVATRRPAEYSAHRTNRPREVTMGCGKGRRGGGTHSSFLNPVVIHSSAQVYSHVVRLRDCDARIGRSRTLECWAGVDLAPCIQREFGLDSKSAGLLGGGGGEVLVLVLVSDGRRRRSYGHTRSTRLAAEPCATATNVQRMKMEMRLERLWPPRM